VILPALRRPAAGMRKIFSGRLSFCKANYSNNHNQAALPDTIHPGTAHFESYR